MTSYEKQVSRAYEENSSLNKKKVFLHNDTQMMFYTVFN